MGKLSGTVQLSVGEFKLSLSDAFLMRAFWILGSGHTVHQRRLTTTTPPSFHSMGV